MYLLSNVAKLKIIFFYFNIFIANKNITAIFNKYFGLRGKLVLYNYYFK